MDFCDDGTANQGELQLGESKQREEQKHILSLKRFFVRMHVKPGGTAIGRKRIKTNIFCMHGRVGKREETENTYFVFKNIFVRMHVRRFC